MLLFVTLTGNEDDIEEVYGTIASLFPVEFERETEPTNHMGEFRKSFQIAVHEPGYLPPEAAPADLPDDIRAWLNTNPGNG